MYNGALLKRGNALATSADCCCDETPCENALIDGFDFGTTPAEVPGQPFPNQYSENVGGVLRGSREMVKIGGGFQARWIFDASFVTLRVFSTTNATWQFRYDGAANGSFSDRFPYPGINATYGDCYTHIAFSGISPNLDGKPCRIRIETEPSPGLLQFYSQNYVLARVNGEALMPLAAFSAKARSEFNKIVAIDFQITELPNTETSPGAYTAYTVGAIGFKNIP